MKAQQEDVHEAGDGVWLWVAATGTRGYGNAGLVVGDGRSLMIDTLYDLQSPVSCSTRSTRLWRAGR